MEPYTGSSIPGSGKLGSSQLLSSFLYIWAKFFDEIKIFIDSFSNIMHVDYDEKETVSDAFLISLAKKYGINIPSLFSTATLEQFFEAENIESSVSTENYSLKEVQNQLLRRLLTNIEDIIKSKGTLYSIKALIRTLGIDPDNSLRIREFGGLERRKIGLERETKTYVANMLNMSASKSFITSSFLSGSRLEVGYPEAVGTFVNKTVFPPHGISNNRNDGLFTSGSWTYEAVYKFSDTTLTSVTQSLVRLLMSTGSNTDSSTISSSIAANLVAITSSSPSVRLYLKGGSGHSDKHLSLVLSGANIFDGDTWHVSFVRKRNDSINSIVSSSYIVRCAKIELNKEEKFFETSSLLQETISDTNIFQNITNTLNVSGTFLAIGSQSLEIGNNVNKHLLLSNTDDVVDEVSRTVLFDGKIGNIRFWTKAFDTEEWKEHVRNRLSLGVKDPFINFNFEKKLSGSFERLRMDIELSQQISASDSNGILELRDFSQNNMHLSASGLEKSKKVVEKEIAKINYISPYFDEFVTSNKVRVRSFLNEENISGSIYSQIAPVYSLGNDSIFRDDPRFSIDFSIIDALNRDIINMFSSLDSINDSIGNMNEMYSADYTELERLMNVYFNRLTDKVRFDDFYKLFKWFDSLLNVMVNQLLPRKTKFLGTNFIIESHMLERPKIEYLGTDMYLTSIDRALPLNTLSEDISKGITK